VAAGIRSGFRFPLGAALKGLDKAARAAMLCNPSRAAPKRKSKTGSDARGHATYGQNESGDLEVAGSYTQDYDKSDETWTRASSGGSSYEHYAKVQIDYHEAGDYSFTVEADSGSGSGSGGDSGSGSGDSGNSVQYSNQTWTLTETTYSRETTGSQQPDGSWTTDSSDSTSTYTDSGPGPGPYSAVANDNDPPAPQPGQGLNGQGPKHYLGGSLDLPYSDRTESVPVVVDPAGAVFANWYQPDSNGDQDGGAGSSQSRSKESSRSKSAPRYAGGNRGVLDKASDFFSGWADVLTFGLTAKYRQWIGADYFVDTSSGYYRAGVVTGFVHDAALWGGIGKGASAKLGKLALRSGEAADKLADARRIGKLGEQAVRRVYDIGRKMAITINGRRRVPDGINHLLETISEVKNAKYVSLTKQLKDYLAWARLKGYKFVLYVRKDADLSQQLQDLVDKGLIILRYIPE